MLCSAQTSAETPRRRPAPSSGLGLDKNLSQKLFTMNKIYNFLYFLENKKYVNNSWIKEKITCLLLG
ncbi:hypothetical protein [Virgibacillus proomii]|uniref:hypothetical protein n=1 Tax=Virgibacillus proomii TaxID=84407 RepID=UPI003CCB763D